MPALIDQILSARDNVEVVRDQIGAILLVELLNQKALTGLDQPRVFVERSKPWGEFLVTENKTAQPIINVWFDSSTFDASASNIVERQKVDATFNVDCYGYGISVDDGINAGGHIPGDLAAAFEAQRAGRLARQILMSAHYTYLAMRGVVWKRWVSGVTMFQPQAENRQAQNVGAQRIALVASFNEFSPQHEGDVLETLSVEVLRAEDGELYLTAEYPDP